MFPLGTVLFPGTALPLHLFEPRYLRFYDEVVAEDGEFGVVLIERGSEVGGGDRRFGVGTAARAMAAASADPPVVPGKFIVAVGSRRIRVVEWLDDDPYPRALVEGLPETNPPGQALITSCLSALETTVGLLSEGEIEVDGWPPELAADSSVALYQLAQLAPIQQIDRQKLLEAADGDERGRLLIDLIESSNELLRLQLGG